MHHPLADIANYEKEVRELKEAIAQSVVHVMATGGTADEIVLKEVAVPNTYVISTDHFDEFRRMPAVAEDRLMKHDIIKGKVYVQRLGLEIAS